MASGNDDGLARRPEADTDADADADADARVPETCTNLNVG